MKGRTKDSAANPGDSPNQPDSPAKISAARPVSAAVSSVELERILVVDDNDTKRYSLSHSLKHAGFLVLEARTGREGLRLAISEEPDLIVLDVKLPDITGFEVCKQLKIHPAARHIPVLMVSASFVGYEDKVRGLEGGADGYISDPFTREEFVAQARVLLRLNRTQKQLRRSEERLRLALEGARAGVWNVELGTEEFAGSFNGCEKVYFSPELRDLYGFGPDELLSTQSWESRVHPMDLPRVYAEIQQRLRPGAGDAWTQEFRVVHPERGIRWVQDLVRVQRDAAGRAISLGGINLDITDRKEQELRLAEQARLLDLPGNAIISRRLDGTIVFWNTGAEHLYGWSRNEAVGKDIHTLLKTSFKTSLEAIHETLFSAGTWTGELDQTRKDGTQLTILNCKVFDRDARDDSALILETNTDISERKRQERNFALLVDLHSDFIRSLSDTEIFEAACRWIGRYLEVDRCLVFEISHPGSPAQAVPRTLGGSGTAEMRYSIADVHSEAERRILFNGQPVEIQDVRSNQEGPEADRLAALGIGSVLSVPYLHEGHCQFVLSAIRPTPNRWHKEDREVLKEVAARVYLRLKRWRAESRFRDLFELTPVGVFLMERRTHRIIECNTRAEHFFGFTREELCRQTIADLGADISQDEMARIDRLAAGNNERVSIDTRFHSKNGEIRDVILTIAPLEIDGEICNFASALDVTDRKRAEDQLRQAHAQLADRAVHLESIAQERTARLNEMFSDLEAFSYSIVHDMRAPLRAMQGFAQLLALECGTSEKAQDFAQRIHTAAERMDHLIQDGLSYGRTIRAELQLTSIDAGALLRGMLESYPSFQPPKVEVEVAENIPRVKAHEAALTQCVSHLIDNAAKFAAPGVTPRVQIWGEKIGNFVRLFFKDNGIGIPPDAYEKIFQIFYRLDPKYEGTGIGLATVKKNTERMGGKVGVESVLGQGSTFWMELVSAAS